MPTQSDIVTETAPELVGMWIHDPADPENTIVRYRNNSFGRQDAYTVTGNALAFSGREYPIYEFGEHTTRSIPVQLLVPCGPNRETTLVTLRRIMSSRQPWVYRDSRARLLYGVAFGVTESDEPAGTFVSFTLNATNFDESLFYTELTFLALASEGMSE